MQIEILGTGCKKCQDLFENTKKAIAQAEVFAQVQKVEDIVKIMDYGVVSTPALVINKEVKSTSKVLSVEEIIEIIK